MSYARELANPWGVLLAGSSTAVAFAIQLPSALAVGVGVAVLLGRAWFAGLARSGSPGAEWVARADAAEQELTAVAADLPDGLLAEQVALLAGGVDAVVRTLRELAVYEKLAGELEIGVVGLENLVARVCELAAVDDPAFDDIIDLADRLDDIRAGVAHAASSSR
ncbi:hypothetical protein [Actinokineospora enzanensis]|uniref:hypothetical protein n=1 Tax=Actinokineospora enzanensis TaxID=155975 RepID=UPI00037E7CFD|nr:hypothetical protein [Actinokineospora enzanensis]